MSRPQDYLDRFDDASIEAVLVVRDHGDLARDTVDAINAKEGNVIAVHWPAKRPRNDISESLFTPEQVRRLAINLIRFANGMD